MPLYEYECEACGHRFEKIQKFSDPLVDTCPTCAGKVHKMFSSPAIQFKGSGFYITDYGKDGKGPRKDPSASITAPPETKSKSDAKPDTKSESKSEAKPTGSAKPGKSDAS
ncbi:MAG: FmdB family zinc ribbon protein [Gemmatimonadota bacterium]